MRAFFPCRDSIYGVTLALRPVPRRVGCRRRCCGAEGGLAGREWTIFPGRSCRKTPGLAVTNHSFPLSSSSSAVRRQIQWAFRVLRVQSCHYHFLYLIQLLRLTIASSSGTSAGRVHQEAWVPLLWTFLFGFQAQQVLAASCSGSFLNPVISLGATGCSILQFLRHCRAPLQFHVWTLRLH